MSGLGFQLQIEKPYSYATTTLDACRGFSRCVDKKGLEPLTFRLQGGCSPG